MASPKDCDQRHQQRETQAAAFRILNSVVTHHPDCYSPLVSVGGEDPRVEITKAGKFQAISEAGDHLG